jgi:hypothetical protein
MDLKKLFIEELNYEPVFKKIRIPEIENKENILDLQIAFEKNDFQIILGRLKNLNPEFEKIIIKNLKKEYSDAIYLFTTPDDKQINIYNIKLTEDKKERIRKLTYDEINNKTQLFKEKIRFFEVSEDITGKLSLKEKIDTAFDTERVTKKFYVEFKKYHDKFLKFIKGIPVEKDAEWYTSVILNRLMFIYFIQKKGFIDNDYDYLKNKFNEIEKQKGNFYSDFLKGLFFEGFAKKDKSEEFKKKYGNVPYLNGGLFLPHPIEKKYKDISIPNEAFKEIIDYFDRYIWYLDERPLRNENEINPDILGYIFEKYINQKELGAYYTKEDITGYICRNTIIPYIFDRIGIKNYQHFLKKIDIEKYVYEGVTDREKRVEEIKKAYQNGEIKDINDFITFNLDIEKFALDFIDNLKDEETLKHLYFDILKNIKILDPTVGSGAFLFAALNILFPMYEKIINKKFLEFKKANSKYWRTFFEREIQKIKEHPNVNYFILKTIIVNNLYGVDIVEEATEICKLRLFLKLAAQIDDVNHIEPLPDIDFNIKAGNTLVGIVDIEKDSIGLFVHSIKNEILELSKKLSQFRANQLTFGEQIAKKFEFYQKQKKEIDEILASLNTKINQKQKDDYNVSYDDFIKNYKPFNWYVEFNEIIKNGGFDVIIGNPPYVEYSKVKNQYKIKGYKTESCGNLYAFVVERSLNLLKNDGRFGMIVPISITNTRRMSPLREILNKESSLIYISSFSDRPSKLFIGAEQELSIAIVKKFHSNTNKIFTTNYIKWYSEQRDSLFQNIQYCDISEFNIKNTIPRLGNKIEKNIWNKFNNDFKIKNLILRTPNVSKVIYIHKRGRYWTLAIDFEPVYNVGKRNNDLSSVWEKICLDNEYADFIICFLNSSLFYWYSKKFLNTWIITTSEILDTPIKISNLLIWHNIKKILMEDLKKHSVIKTIEYRYKKVKQQLFYPSKSKHIIDEIDRELAKHYGFTEEELNFIINYDIKFRMGKEEEN